MSVEMHLSELRRKHADLSRLVEREQRSPGASDQDIVNLKREKLRLKEEMARLSPLDA